MLKLALAVLGLVATVTAFGAQREFRDRCESEMAEGLKVLHEVYKSLGAVVEEERETKLIKKRTVLPAFSEIITKAMIDKKKAKKNKKHQQLDDDDDDQCPGEFKMGMKCFAHDLPPSTEKISYRYPRLTHDHDHIMDPLAAYAEQLHIHLTNISACDGMFTNLNSITEAQLYGFFSLLATRTPGPFCPLCHHFAEELEERLLRPIEIIAGSGHGIVSHLFSHIPTPKTLCTSIAPGCHANYAVKAGSYDDASVCTACSFCNIVANILQHKVLLDKDLMDRIYNNLQQYFFHAACVEMCCTADQFPPEFQMDYNKCQETAKKTFYRLVDAAKTLLRPERICALELGWCQLNETPNILHCLREGCQGAAGDNPFLQWVCTQIPDRPRDADEFLNVQMSKIYKQKTAYHTDYEENMRKKRDAGEL